MDSKISQLPYATAIYDHDLIVGVTGYGIEGSYPDNIKISFDQIRHDIIRLDEMIYLLSGFSGYYNEQNNTMTITSHQYAGNLMRLDYSENWPYIQIISTTGLNAVAGNKIELQFNTGTPASNKYGHTGYPYYSGIISVTGLNAHAGNRIFISEDSNWPHGGTISTTGLNAIFDNGISYSIDSLWPHTYDIKTIDRAKHINTSTTVYNTGDWYYPLITPATTIGSNLSINNIYGSKNYNSSVKVLVTAMFKITNISLQSIPSVSYGSWGDELEGDLRKKEELSHLIGTSYTYSYNTPCIEGNPDTRVSTNGNITWTTGDLAFFSATNAVYIDNTCTLNIGISGAGALHNNSMSSVISLINYDSPLFRDNTRRLYLQNKDITTAPDSQGYTHYVSFVDSPHVPYPNMTIPSIDPIVFRSVITLYNTSASEVASNSVGLYATLSNVQYQRSYRSASLAYNYNSDCSYNEVYYTTYTNGYARTNATINCQILKIEHIV